MTAYGRKRTLILAVIAVSERPLSGKADARLLSPCHTQTGALEIDSTAWHCWILPQEVSIGI